MTDEVEAAEESVRAEGERIATNVVGIRCTRGTWVEAVAIGDDLPAFCPACKAVTCQYDVAKFWDEILKVQAGDYPWPEYKKTPQPEGWQPVPHPGYWGMWVWAVESKRCFNHPQHMKNSYKKHTGIDVSIEL